ncbi:MAG: type II toxin-antitoxin system MqsA family antitoxin [Pseudomonadota bacterium]
MKKCPFCKDGLLERKTIKETYKYKGHTLEVEQPGEWCNVCEEGILNGADLKATEKLKNDFQSQVDGLLTSEEIRTIRNKLKLTQKQAAELCGGAPNAFSSYERGEAIPMRSTSHLLRLLNNHPLLLNELMSVETI